MRSPSHIGAIAPSFRHLARAVTCAIAERGEPVVVELAPGTGPFTAGVQRTLAGRGRHLAVEINPRLAELLRDRFAHLLSRVAIEMNGLLDRDLRTLACAADVPPSVTKLVTPPEEEDVG